MLNGIIRFIIEILDIFLYFLFRHEQYGPVFKCQLGGDIFVNTSDRQLIKDLFITKNYPKTMALFKRVMFPYNQRFCGYGLSSGMHPKLLYLFYFYFILYNLRPRRG